MSGEEGGIYRCLEGGDCVYIGVWEEEMYTGIWGGGVYIGVWGGMGVHRCLGRRGCI